MRNKTTIDQTSDRRMFGRYVSFHVLSMLGLSLYVLADTFFVANGVGSDGLAALNLVLPVYSLLNGLGLMLGMGGATRFSIARGEGKKEFANQIFTQATLCATILGVLITALGLLFADDLLHALQTPEEIRDMATVYIRTILSFSLAFLLNNLLIAFVRNDGAPQLAMTAMLTASLSNIFLDYLFVYPLQMGIFGAAFATGCSPVISTLVLSIHFIKRKNHFHFERVKVKWREIGRIVLVGLPSFVTEFSSGVVILAFNLILLSIAGATGVAAYGIIANIALVCLALFNGVGQGIQPLISAQYGQRKANSMKATYRSAILTAVGMGIVFYLLGLCFPREMVSLFNQEQNRELAAIAEHGILLYFFAFPFMGCNIVSTTFLACSEKAASAFWGSILRGIVFVLPLVLILPTELGLDGVWISVPMAELLTCIVNIFFVSNFFKRIKYNFKGGLETRL